MKIFPITNNNLSTNPAFGTKIKYNETMQKAFETAKAELSKASKNKKIRKEVQNFIENINLILKSKKQKKASFDAAPCFGTVYETEGNKVYMLANHPFSSEEEGNMCIRAVEIYASFVKHEQLKVIKKPRKTVKELAQELEETESRLIRG